MPLRESEAKVLLALSDENIPIMSLPKKAKLGGSAVYNSVRWLTARGLVDEKRENKPPRRRMIGLTDHGRLIASLLEKIEQEL